MNVVQTWSSHHGVVCLVDVSEIQNHITNVTNAHMHTTLQHQGKAKVRGSTILESIWKESKTFWAPIHLDFAHLQNKFF